MSASCHRLPVLVVLGSLSIAACGGATPDPAERWEATIAFQADTKLGGCAVGDLDSRYAGNEIAAVAVDGRVYVVRAWTDGWVTETVAELPGEGIQCAIGDVDASRPGNELVVVGMAAGTEDDGGAGAVHLVYLEEDGWKSERVLQDAALVHGVDVGDVDPAHPGNEIVITGFSGASKVLGTVDGAWTVLSEHPLPEAAGKSVLVDGDRTWIANTGSALERIGGTAVEIGGAQARLGRGAEDVVVACDDGGLRLVAADGALVIHQESQKLRGAALGDLDPLVDGEEAATVGYEMTMTVLYRPADGSAPWTPVTVWEDTAKFHHLAKGELLAAGAGPELVAVGYSGRVIVAWCAGP
jgi:hypothetical protein